MFGTSPNAGSGYYQLARLLRGRHGLMAVTNGYATVTQLKGYIDQGGAVTIGTNDDTELEFAINAASRQIDAHCNRRFYLDGAATARVFVAEHPTLLKVHDFSTSTGFIVETDTTGSGTFDRTWTTADYQLEPLNGISAGIEGWPYWRVRAIDDEAFPVDTRARVRVTAKWGWAAVPDAVLQACLIQSLANFKRKDAPYGVVGFDEYGAARAQVEMDKGAQGHLAPYRRGDLVVAVG